MQKKFVLGVDLDGVVADFYESLRPIAAEWLGVAEASLSRQISYGLPEWELDRMGGYEPLHRFAVTKRGLFERLTPVSGAPATLRRLAARDDVRIRIITHRLFIKHFHREAASQTVNWLEHHGIPYWDLCLMQDKAAVGADLYIEDSPTNIKSLRAAGCEVLVFENATNLSVSGPRAANWDQVYEYVISKLTKWPAAADEPCIAAANQGDRPATPSVASGQ